MTDRVRIRGATPADVEGIARVAREGWHAAHDDIVGPEAVETMLERHHTWPAIHRRIRDDRGRNVVAVVDAVVGFAAIVPDDEDPARWHLGAIYVDDDHRGMGIGGRLLEAAEDRAREGGGAVLDLVVMAENERARGFYEAQGYEAVERTRNEDLGVEDVHYERRLTD